MDQKPLVIEETDAGAELVTRFESCMPVQAAFWLRPADENDWNLYIASDQINENAYDLGYGEILRLAQEMRDPNLDPFRVRRIPATSPLAEAARKFNPRFPGKMATRFQDEEFGGSNVNGVYVYPIPIRVS
jgi:hypothetical protein